MLPFLLVEALVLWLLHGLFARSMVEVVTSAGEGRDLVAFLVWCGLVDLAAALAIGLPLAGLARLIGRRLGWPLMVLAFAAAATVVWVDARVFSVQGVHFYDPIAVRALTNPDANRELHLGWRVAAEVAAVFLGALAFGGFAAWRLHRAPRPRRFVTLHVALLVVAALSTLAFRSRLFAAGSPLAPALPFARLVVHSAPPPATWTITYPGPLPPHVMTRKPNILVVAVESLRADAFTPELMPQLTRFAQAHGCIVPRRHFSSSHATELGIFSLLYGLDAARYPSFAQMRTPSAILTILRDNGYAIRGGSASALRGWNDAAFLADQIDGFVEPADRASWRRDAALSAWARALPARTPAFTFLFLDATHLDYSYPPELEIDKPVARGDFTRYLARDGLASRKLEVVNRYRNAVRYVDRTIGELLPTLGDGVVIVTGDHGEEFWEEGLLGHSAPRFINPRIQVPLVLCLPGSTPPAVERSSHADILPTVLAWAGVSAPADGESLLDARHGDVVVTAAGFPTDAGGLCLIGEQEKLWLAADPGWEDRFRLVRATDLDDHPLAAAPSVDAHVADFVHRFHRWFKSASPDTR